MGSSKLVEFLVALLVGVLAILASLFCIGFLLVEPIKSPPSQQPTVSLADLFSSEECAVESRQQVLPLGCTHDGSQFLSVSSCSQRECSCEAELLAAGSLCCCRATQQVAVEGVVCPQDSTLSGLSTVTACGCTACDDIEVTISLSVQVMRSYLPIAAAQIFRVNGTVSDNDFTFIGITDNMGRFHHRVLAAERTAVLRVQVPGYVPQFTPPFNLRPDTERVGHTVVMMPSVEIAVGMGDSPVDLQLGDMLSITAPPDSFTDMDGQVYRDLVILEGCVVDILDDAEAATIPSSSFVYFDPSAGDQPLYFAALLAWVFSFQDPSGLPLQISHLNISVAMAMDTLPEDLLMLTFDPSALGGWVKSGVLSAQEESKRKKRQSGAPIIFDGSASPLSLLNVVASRTRVDCWLQSRAFQSDTVTPLPDILITVRHCAFLSGIPVFLQFTAETGQRLSSGESLQSNAVCLPVVCQQIITASLEAEGQDSINLLPIGFSDGVFMANETAPVALGSLFLFEELPFNRANKPRPFYRSAEECINAGSLTDTAASRNEYFKFAESASTPLLTPSANDSCFIKIQIRGCSPANVVTVRSLEPSTGLDVQPTALQQLLVVANTSLETRDNNTFASGGGATEDTPTSTITTDTPDSGCNMNTATLRAACVPYVCGTTLHLIVSAHSDNPTLQYCEVTDRSALLQTSFFASSSTANLPVMTADLLAADFNNPELGLYSDVGSTLMASGFAEQRCNAGLGEDHFSSTVDPETGIAAVFTCFDDLT